MTTATVPPATQPPHSAEAETSVVGQMLAQPALAGEVVGAMLEPRHFYVPALRALYHEIVTAYYADDAIDALTIGELAAKTLARAWGCTEEEAVARVQEFAAGHSTGTSAEALSHAALVKRDFDYRALLELAASIQRDVTNELQSPDDVAGSTAETAMQIATSQVLSHEILSFAEVGRNLVRTQRDAMAAEAAGVERGAYFGMPFLDDYLRGLRPGELFILAGEPGAGKSAVGWKATQQFAERQMSQPEEKRRGALILSLEMTEEPSSTRVAQSLTGIDGGKLREGKTTEIDLAQIIAEWGARKELPLYYNFGSVLRATQMRALIVEGIRKHGICLVVIDHMRYFTMDGTYRSKAEEDEDKALYLKQMIAMQLNVAVVCLAHTTKIGSEDKRPTLDHLLGGRMVSAHADFVGFVHRPYRHASQKQIEEGTITRTDAELIWAKDRHAPEATARFFFDPSTMAVV